MTARIQAVDWQKNELHSCSTDEERLDFLFQFSEGDFLHSGLCVLGVFGDTFRRWMRNEKTFPTVSNVVVALVVDEILLFECEGQT